MATAKKPAMKKPAAKKPAQRGPGVGGGKLGQRLAASAGAYRSSNISGEVPQGVVYGGYNQGDTMEKITRNEWLNTLSEPEKMRAMNQMGYWTGGTPTATPRAKVQPSKAFIKGVGLTPGESFNVERGGVFSGQIVNRDGKNVYEPLRPARGKGGAKPKGKGGAKPKGKGKGKPANRTNKLKGGTAVGGGGGESSSAGAASEKLYAEADVATTSYRRAQGKQYGRGSGRGLEGQTQSPSEKEEGDSTVAKNRGKRKTVTKKKNKRGNVVTRVRKGGKVVKKTVAKKK